MASPHIRDLQHKRLSVYKSLDLHREMIELREEELRKLVKMLVHCVRVEQQISLAFSIGSLAQAQSRYIPIVQSKSNAQNAVNVPSEGLSRSAAGSSASIKSALQTDRSW
jgi:hypothetical protein